MTEAPDYFEPLEAWRVWRVIRSQREYVLRSVVQRTLWQPGEPFSADCLRSPRLMDRLRRKPQHDAPEADCNCGIYGAALDVVDSYLADPPFGSDARVVGTVALWGTVVECEHGFRASHAYPSRIYVPSDVGRPWRVDWEDVAVSLWRYGVPVEAVDSRARHAAEVLAERAAPSSRAMPMT